LKRIVDLFPLWVILFAIVGLIDPSLMAGWKGVIVPGLGIIMLGMGMTLTFDDILRVVKDPKGIFVGFFLQFTIMPLVGFILARLFGFSPELLVGMVLVGSSPGGTASNVITYLAKGDVALSVSMTSFNTFLSPVMTPFLTYLLAGHWVPVPVWGMFKSILIIIIIPVTAGLMLRYLFPRVTKSVNQVFPLISVFTIALLVGIIVSLNRERILEAGAVVVLAVILHNLTGFLLGYWGAAIFIKDVKQRRTVSIEVGMQNSGLAMALAIKHFSALAALPSAFFSVWHNISGPILATVWRREDNG